MTFNDNKFKFRSDRGLSPAKDVEVQDCCYSALSDDPWLRLEFNGSPPSGRWIRLTYASSLLDELVRPAIRCFIGACYKDEFMPGPLLGRGIWLGRIPVGATEVWISPTNRRGPFSFVIEELILVSSARILLRFFGKAPLGFFGALGAQIVGLPATAYTKFRRALGPTSLQHYDEWRRLRQRPFDPTNLDFPRSDWLNGPQVRFVTALDFGNLSDLHALVSDLSLQPYPNWTLAVIFEAEDEERARSVIRELGERVIAINADARASSFLGDLSDNDFVSPLRLGDRLLTYSLAALVEASAREPATAIFYGDYEYTDIGNKTLLRLNPDWSPVFCTGFSYVSGTEAVQVGVLNHFLFNAPAVDLLRAMDALNQLNAYEQLTVGHVRRVLRRRRHTAALELSRSVETSSSGFLPSFPTTIIIPTRDRIDLLESCIRSLRKADLSSVTEVIIVDNGSQHSSSHQFFKMLTQDKKFRVISNSGSFNFSRLCNEAAAEANSSILVFLNNDIEVMNNRWLEPLIYWATQKDVGAVGAKLLYPNDRLQHAGVVLGLGGLASHFERMLGKDDPGYFGRLCVPHEVSAVTAACLAVDKRKFELVGGFDAINLPIELNDIDFCLRLSEQGLKTICATESILMHHESASRGKKIRREEFYRKEREYFRRRWSSRLRDDPYFHPALSLDTKDAALG